MGARDFFISRSENGECHPAGFGNMSNMNLDVESCYQAVVTHDARFDGVIFVGVATTGVYCRTVCPAKTPRRRSCRFFPSAAAAERAEFRPCLRCCPEAAPGTLAWDGSAAILSRALQLVDRGYLDEHAVTELAGELTVGARQLIASLLGTSVRRHFGSPVPIVSRRPNGC